MLEAVLEYDAPAGYLNEPQPLRVRPFRKFLGWLGWPGLCAKCGGKEWGVEQRSFSQIVECEDCGNRWRESLT